MALTDRYDFGSNTVNTSDLEFGANLVPEIGGVTPNITSVSTLRPETVVTITLDGPITEPIVNINRGGRAYTNITILAPNLIEALSPKSGQLLVEEALTLEDANGLSNEIPVLLEAPVGYSVATLDGGPFPNNSLLANSGWPETTGNQFVLQTYFCDADGVQTTDELLPGDYPVSVWYNDILNNYQASATDTLTITVADWTVNFFAFPPNDTASPGQSVQGIADIDGIDVDVTMVITNPGPGREISNDDGSTWFTTPIASIPGQNKARATVTANLTPGETEQETVEVNRTSATFTVTTAGAGLLAPELGPYVTPAEITKGVFYSFPPTIIQIGIPAGQFTDADSDLPDGFTVDIATGIASGIATINGATIGDVRLENSEGFSDGAFNITVVEPLPTIYELRFTDIRDYETNDLVDGQLVNVRIERVSDGGEVHRGVETITNGVLVITTGISSAGVAYRTHYNSNTFGDRNYCMDDPSTDSQVQI